ncbi:MAG: hypothetical protein H7305_02700, partial [Gemmatimonadaceae bacterium]|nr:hypothetical protein [Gemmatimonadaceae bacterium]
WQGALDRYPAVVAGQNVAALLQLDQWYRDELPGLITARSMPHATLAELVRVTEWKMYRGVWRAPNLVRVQRNDADLVRATTARALALVPHPTKPVTEIATLDGVGPATASAIMAASAPSIYPFFDELVAAQIPSLGPVAWTRGYYAKYAEALRVRAGEFGTSWTPVMLERALWANVGGKAGFSAD